MLDWNYDSKPWNAAHDAYMVESSFDRRWREFYFPPSPVVHIKNPLWDLFEIVICIRLETFQNSF